MTDVAGVSLHQNDNGGSYSPPAVPAPAHEPGPPPDGPRPHGAHRAPEPGSGGHPLAAPWMPSAAPKTEAPGDQDRSAAQSATGPSPAMAPDAARPVTDADTAPRYRTARADRAFDGREPYPAYPVEEPTLVAAADPLSPAAEPTPYIAPSTAVVKGRIEVKDEVVEKIAALAALEVEGVAGLGGEPERLPGPPQDKIAPRRGLPGARARIADRQVSVNVVIAIEYGHVVMDVAKEVKANVARAVNRMLALRVVEVNVTVDDVRMPKSRGRRAEPSPAPARS
ncbi:Asp23/Gls24 family envelope stress response protein [Bailinhaonella thermotolerans]|uniref:Asp23/Gls24 family envelope stress response protein n=1 Tax=Bailinhaonella thermotolerans TaxID=1070861 RepID=A0A3A4B8I7_9ACTN|nr:Asp23/Gls24 family envelope stress response protein [Bailinhaonella thermotolerans]RJL34004.1 Asp23/Gls24 family envelope stress response protein [Bailinhaonella thermotolerans]